jgi:hypothetical protein
VRTAHHSRQRVFGVDRAPFTPDVLSVRLDSDFVAIGLPFPFFLLPYPRTDASWREDNVSLLRNVCGRARFCLLVQKRNFGFEGALLRRVPSCSRFLLHVRAHRPHFVELSVTALRCSRVAKTKRCTHSDARRRNLITSVYRAQHSCLRKTPISLNVPAFVPARHSASAVSHPASHPPRLSFRPSRVIGALTRPRRLPASHLRAPSWRGHAFPRLFCADLRAEARLAGGFAMVVEVMVTVGVSVRRRYKRLGRLRASRAGRYMPASRKTGGLDH